LACGNPVRPEIAALAPPERRLAGRTGPLRLLGLGGSLGARALNLGVPAALAQIAPERRPEVRHQAGERTLQEAEQAYREHGVNVQLSAFIQDMAEAYAWADLVIARAGALTLSELAAAGVGAVLVPYPHAVDDHQTGNARWLVDAGAAQLLPQPRLEAGELAGLLLPLLEDRGRLLQMALAARGKAMTDAARTVARACLEVAKR
jgi:UDP-N-acetylglucosamine--N-acetylmuramyl-(pentapeptide) pyrophosphoryl-undecaprenol N-acetylglucosamine transferase